jgi:hypothetical protein
MTRILFCVGKEKDSHSVQVSADARRMLDEIVAEIGVTRGGLVERLLKVFYKSEVAVRMFLLKQGGLTDRIPAGDWRKLADEIDGRNTAAIDARGAKIVGRPKKGTRENDTREEPSLSK